MQVVWGGGYEVAVILKFYGSDYEGLRMNVAERKCSSGEEMIHRDGVKVAMRTTELEEICDEVSISEACMSDA